MRLVMLEEVTENLNGRRASLLIRRHDLRLEVFDLCQGRALIRKIPCPNAQQESPEICSKADAEHGLPDEFLPVLDTENNHHASNGCHDDQDDVHRSEDSTRQLCELRIKSPAEPCSGLYDGFRTICERWTPAKNKNGEEDREHNDAVPSEALHVHGVPPYLPTKFASRSLLACSRVSRSARSRFST